MRESQCAAWRQKSEPESARIEVARMFKGIVDVLGAMEGGNWEIRKRQSIIRLYCKYYTTWYCPIFTSLYLLSAPRVKWRQVAAAWHWPVWCLAPGPPPAGRTWRGARSCGRATGAGTRALDLATGSCSCYSCQRGFAKFHRPRLYYSYFLPVSTCLLVWCFQIKEYNKTLC